VGISHWPRHPAGANSAGPKLIAEAQKAARDPKNKQRVRAGAPAVHEAVDTAAPCVEHTAR